MAMTRQVLARYMPVSVGAAEGTDTVDNSQPKLNPGMGALSTVLVAGSYAGGAMGVYHGYKRNDSIGWALGWGLVGSMFWPITVPLMFAQGFGKPAK